LVKHRFHGQNLFDRIEKIHKHVGVHNCSVGPIFDGWKMEIINIGRKGGQSGFIGVKRCDCRTPMYAFVNNISKE
jgi:hypothetical protein